MIGEVNTWMRSIGLLLLFFLGSVSVLPARDPVIVRAADYGVVADSRQNAAPGLRRALEACRRLPASVLVLPAGRIDVWPEGAARRELYVSNCTENDTSSKIKNIAFLLEDCRNLVIEGNNSLIMLHGKMISFVVLRSRNITIRNIGFDYERPTMSELTIASVGKKSIEAVVHPDSRFSIDSGRLRFYGEGWVLHAFHTILFDPKTEQLRYSSLQPLLEAKARQTGSRRVLFEGNFGQPPYKVGDILTVRDPYRDNCGAFIEQSRNVELYQVGMHYMHGLGIVSQFSEDLRFRKVAVAPRAETGRIIAAFADCFHFSGCRGRILLDSCRSSGSHDDPVNVHGTHLQVTAIRDGRKLTVRFMHHQTYGFPAFFAGDSIAFIDPKTLLTLGGATLQTAVLMNSREMLLELKEPLPAGVSTGHCVENLTWTPEVCIRNCRFERTNTRGVLITTPRKVQIEHNVFSHTGMFPVLIADDASSWFESGAVRDVTIRNNLFDACGYNSNSGAIAIAPENHQRVPGSYVHHNIRITGNRFRTWNAAVLQARSVDRLIFEHNKIRPVSAQVKWTGAAVELDGCAEVSVNGNQLPHQADALIIINQMPENAIHTDWRLANKK
ncbi:right-handed parallel beta-helix repeat-containing protein [Niabella beijingensis]|uniref:right-handed parallel beta-helix repeat-containing protein n=1 Tax=Niabella beijingensis TaxID=2872700 RepID=UPI001CBBD626|nr:right-handed parallel beta-helix repeat-containing protein [Niabella beijingensis]MBZ4191421.1 right-handed parallel beta-helix repeat-containing protein [Niabella beijingensis]